MKALRVRVEKAVRPVRATDKRKDRMREELFGHLIEIYRAELARQGDEQVAEEAAKQRFGAPANLTDELQRAVPRLERILHWPVPGLQTLDTMSRLVLVQRQSGESVERHAVRNFGAFLLLPPVAIAAVILMLIWARIGQTSVYPAFAELRILLGCTMIGILALAARLFPDSALGLGGVVRGKLPNHQVRHGATLSLILFVAGSLFLLLLKQSGLYEHWHVSILAICSVVAPLVFGTFLQLVVRDARRYEEWGRLKTS